MSLELVAGAIAQLQIGAVNIRDELLNYQLPYPVPDGFVLGVSALGGVGGLGTLPGQWAIPVLATDAHGALQVEPLGQVMQTGVAR